MIGIDQQWEKRWKMKKLTIVLLVMLLLSGCSSKIRYNSQYGVRHVLDENGITIHLDEKKNDVIADMWITSSRTTTVLENPNEEWNADMTKAEDFPITYYVQANEDGTYLESIVLRFYRDDFSFENAAELLKYIGLAAEADDSELKYKAELLKSNTFSFSDLLKNGTFYNNISLDGNPKFEYKG